MIGYFPLILTNIAVRGFVRLVDDGLRYKNTKTPLSDINSDQS